MENQNKPTPDIPNHLALAILTTIFCCLPFGIVSIIYAAQVNSALAVGNFEAAKKNSEKAKFWSLLAAGIGILFSVIYGAMIIVGALAQNAAAVQ